LFLVSYGLIVYLEAPGQQRTSDRQYRDDQGHQRTQKSRSGLARQRDARYQMQAELVYAAEIQAKLLPRGYPSVPGFDIVVAHCMR